MFASNQEQQHGYDAAFMEDISEELKCSICQLVLREAVQIMTCGHRFCTPCFQRMKEHSMKMGDELLCPEDRGVVSMDQVFPGRGITRSIGNLKVRCGNFEHGCTWVDDLRDLQNHEDRCRHRTVQNRGQCGKEDGSSELLKDLLQRVLKVEENMVVKEKEIAQLKLAFKELKEDSEKKEKEIKSLETGMAKLVAYLPDQQTNLEDIKKEDIKSMIEVNKDLDEKITLCLAEVEHLKGKIDQKQEPSLDADIGQLKNPLDLAVKEVGTCKTNIVKSISESSVEVDALTKRLDSIEERIEGHVVNIENVLFTYDSLVSKDVVFKWVVENFHQKFNTGETVASPVFYPELEGYCFQMFVKWFGEKKEIMGLFLRLFRGRSKIKNLPPFRHEYTLKVHDKNGGSKDSKVLYEQLDNYRDGNFLIPDERVEAEKGYGKKKMLAAPYNDYIINNSLIISCTLHL